MQTPLSQIKEIMLSLIRCELTNNEIDETTKRLLENQILLSDLFIFSKRHDLSHLMASVLSKNDIRLRRVLLLRSDIRLTPSDIRFASFGVDNFQTGRYYFNSPCPAHRQIYKSKKTTET